MDTTLKVDIIFTNEDVEETMTLITDAAGSSVTKVRQAGFTGIEDVVLVMLGVSALSDLVQKLARRWRSGVVVDLRGSRVVTERSSDIPRGDVLIIRSGDDRVTLHEPAAPQIGAILSALNEGP